MNRSVTITALYTLVAFATGCGMEPSYDEATAESLDSILTRDPDNAEALARIHALNEAEDRRLGFLTAVDFGDGKITFFEAQPGLLGVRAIGDEAARALADYTGIEDEVRMSELFERLAPGEAIPQSLLEAQARADELTESDELGGFEVAEELPANASVEGIGTTSSGLSSSQFLSGGGCPTGGSADWCLTPWGGGAWAQRWTNRGWFRIAPSSGLVRFRILINGSVQAQSWISTSNNFVHAHYWKMGTVKQCRLVPVGLIWITQCNHYPRYANIRGEIVDASGDTFHFGGRFLD